MSISYLGKWTNDSGTTSATPTATSAPTYAVGDLLVLVAVNHPTTETPTLSGVSGWTQVDTHTGGAGSLADDAGPRRVTVWYKVAASTSETIPTVTIGTAGGVTANLHAYARTAGVSWALAAAHGSDDTAGSGAGSYSVTMGAGIAVASGDMLLAVAGTNTDGSGSGGTRTITASGLTVAALTAIDNVVTTTGNDQRLDSHYATVTGGSTSSAATYTAGFATQVGSYAPTGPTVLVRIREQLPADAVASYQLAATYPAQSATPTSWTVTATGSTGTVTLSQDSGTTATVVESPTGVFTITNPAGGDALVFTLTATSSGAAVPTDTETITIHRGTPVIERPARWTFQGGTATDITDWA